jgi:mRNA interferase RelE/StbE
VLLHPKAAEFLRNSEENIVQRIKERLKELCEEPAGKGERLRHSTYYRLRIGDYRAIYMLEEGAHKVIVLFIGHRRDVYDDFSRLV